MAESLAMATPLRVLLVEDSEIDAQLLLGLLERAGYDVTHERVQTAEAMSAALRNTSWDLVISDYSMPTFSAPAALSVLQSTAIDLPFIIVSGMVGEETAVAALKAGAHDFMIKGRLARLAPAIERELREAAGRRERVRLEEQLRQSQKLEAVGRLAGGVAHDFNNVLTAILGFSELLLAELPEDDPKYHDVFQIKAAGQRGAGLTRQLLAFSRKQILQPLVLDVNTVIAGMEPMLRQLIVEDIELRISLMPRSALIKIDPTQLEQILINLAVNAADAMPRGGKVTIETAAVTLDEGYRQQHLPVTPGRYVMVAVSDTGVGMNATTIEHIFEPFFTTKPVGKGTGLGLATVYGIVKQSGGDILVSSELERGTTFKIYLPLSESVAPSAVDGRTDVRRTPRGSETVLLVEDDEAVRQFARVTLLRDGYHVLEAENPKDALRVAGECSGPIHLLLSDVVMPESEGLPLFDRLRPAHPGVRVLYMSGYADEAVLQRGVMVEGTPFLQKPFTPDELTRKVRAVLEAPAVGP
jgi:two-component system cell cycle sensor histidine kinase/response regulator CckA